MTNNERKISLTCGLEILQKVHSDMCNSRDSKQLETVTKLTYIITDLIKIIYEMNVDEM